MSIVKMKRLRIMGLSADREALLKQLMHLGCVEICEPTDKLSDPEWAALVHQDETALTDVKAQHAEVLGALETLDKYAPVKTGLFSLRRIISEKNLFDDNAKSSALIRAEQIRTLETDINTLYAEESKLQNSKISLLPWQTISIPLDTGSTKTTTVAFGTIPSSFSYERLERELADAADTAQLYHAHVDQEQHYFLFLCHKSQEESVLDLLKTFGFSHTTFKDMSKTAKEHIAEIDNRLAAIEAELAEVKSSVSKYSTKRDDLKLCVDRLAQEISKEDAKEKLLFTSSAFFFEAWVSVPEEEAVKSVLSSYACGYDLSDPTPEDNVPIKLKSNRLTNPLNMVTEMYSLPTYDGIDPNGLIMPFFLLFFGIMYADLGYGIILLVLGMFLKRKLKPRGTINYMTGLLIQCGITTAIFGVLFGSIFGDALPVASETFRNTQMHIWSLIDPLQNPMGVLLGSLALGVVHIFVGMCVKVYMLCREKKYVDALFDVGSWWLVFAGIVVLVLNGSSTVLYAGIAALVLTQGRRSKSIPGKIMGGVASLYDITAYLSDILSYSRLMALLLATSVIASVVNILGTLSGSIIVFVIVFVIGHAFNMAINIIGTYVHAARLQYLEFFSKFYKEGGVAFRPLKIDTKYHDVVKN